MLSSAAFLLHRSPSCVIAAHLLSPLSDFSQLVEAIDVVSKRNNKIFLMVFNFWFIQFAPPRILGEGHDFIFSAIMCVLWHTVPALLR
jgi:hypothetical protein